MRSFSERSTIGRKLSGRFVAGMSVDDVLACCERVNREDIAATLDSLGESVATEAEANGVSTVITLLAGVEPILEASPKSSPSTILAPWSLSSGGGGEAATP